MWSAGDNLHSVATMESQQLVAERELEGTGEDDPKLIVRRRGWFLATQAARFQCHHQRLDRAETGSQHSNLRPRPRAPETRTLLCADDRVAVVRRAREELCQCCVESRSDFSERRNRR